MNFDTHAQLLEAALALSQVKEGEKAVLLSSRQLTDLDLMPYAEALARTKADFIRVQFHPTNPRELKYDMPPMLVAALVKADFVLQVRPFQYPSRFPAIKAYSGGFREISDSGTRWLDIMIDEANQRRLFPGQEMIHRAQKSAATMQEANEIRVTSDRGSDLVMSKDGRKGHRQVGVVDAPGMWDNFGFGMIACAPLEDSANGVLVLSPGDYLLQMNLDVADEVVLRVEDGKIREIEGGRTADYVRRWLEAWEDPEAYGTSHIGWGVHSKGVWRDSPHFCVADAESYPGIIQIAFGYNTMYTSAPYSGFGGTRKSSAHLDIDLMGQDFYLDGQPMVVKGKELISPEQ